MTTEFVSRTGRMVSRLGILGSAIAISTAFPSGVTAFNESNFGAFSIIATQRCQDCAALLSKNVGQFQKAAAYAMEKGGDGLVILENDQIVVEEYANGYIASKPHTLGSGTKSLIGIMAITAVQDRLLKLDEPVANTITEWQKHPLRSKITVRQLLTLTSGISGGKLGEVPTFAEAIQAPLTLTPGKGFQYGPIPFQIFGELMRRKLAVRRESPVTYLKRKVFAPIELRVSAWTLGADGNPNLPLGASLTARDWARLGRLLERQGRWSGKKVLDKKLIKQCYEGSEANPGYGLSFWLNTPGLSPFNKPEHFLSPAPEDTVMAAGADGQRLYVIPSRKLVIVRFGTGNQFDDNAFLSLLPQPQSSESR